MTVPNRHLDLINGELIITINTRLCSQLLTHNFILSEILSWSRGTTRESNNPQLQQQPQQPPPYNGS